MPEFPTSRPSLNNELANPNDPQVTQSVLRKPWLNLIIFSVLNGVLFTVILTIIGIVLSSSLVSWAMYAGTFVVSILGISFSFTQLVILILDTLLATFVFYFIHRKRTIAIPKTAAVMVIGVFAFGSLALPLYISQAREQVANPIQMGTKQFNFSDETIINNREAAKDTLAISGNAVIWIEHTKESPPYDSNAWDLFLFTFDQDSGRGETIQLTDADKAIHKTPDTAIIDGDTVYWTVDAKLYKYSISMRRQEVIREKTAGIYAINDNVALVSGLDEGKYGGVSIYGVPIDGYYLVDLSTKAIVRDVSQYEHASWFTGTVGSDAYCSYDYDTGNVRVIPLTTEPNMTEVSLPYSTEVSNEIVACSADAVVFTFADGLGIYDIKTATTATIDSSVTSVRAKLINGILYFVDQKYKLRKYDPQTGKTEEIAMLPPDSWNDHQRYWDMSQGYTVYLEHTSEFGSNIHLKHLLETK